jgi:hypothetical protein
MGSRGEVEKVTDGRWKLASLALIYVSAGCGGQIRPDCVMPPCAMPMAIIASVTSAAGGSVPGLTLTWSGATSGSGQCTAAESATECVVPGLPGTYNLQLAAVGFQDQTLSLVVTGSTPACGCTSVQTQRVSVVLTPR